MSLHASIKLWILLGNVGATEPEVAFPVAVDSQIRVSAAQTALAKAGKLSGRQAHEVWRVMQLITASQSREGLPGPVVQAAMDFIHFPKAWKVVATKALIYKRLSRRRDR